MLCRPVLCFQSLLACMLVVTLGINTVAFLHFARHDSEFHGWLSSPANFKSEYLILPSKLSSTCTAHLPSKGGPGTWSKLNRKEQRNS